MESNLPRYTEYALAILISLGVSFWIPLHFIYEPDLIKHAEFFELIIAIPAIGLILLRLRNRRNLHPGDSSNSSRENQLNGKAGLYMDILGMLPLTFIFNQFGLTSLTALLVTKILYVRYLRSIKRMTDSLSSIHPIFYRLLPMALVVPVLVHWMACAWIALGSGTAGHDDDSVMEYIRAIYYAFSTLTTVGYGDISAKTGPQMIFACFAEIMGVGFFGFVVSNVAALLARLDAAREHHLTRLDRIENYMRYNKIDGELKTRIRGFFNFAWQNNQGVADDEILNDLPPNLKTEISFTLQEGLIQNVPLLKDAEPEAVRELVQDLRSRICIPGEVIFAQGDDPIAMYFIKTGCVEIQMASGEIVATLQASQFFGEMALVSKTLRSASAVVVTYCELAILSKENFNVALAKYPMLRASVENTIAQRRASTFGFAVGSR